MSLVHTDVAAPAVIVDHIRRLVECESPSADSAAVARSAEQVAALGVELLGVEPERLVVDGTTHLRWRFGDATRVLLLTHHDTVWPIGSLATHPFAVRDGVLTGPGSFDMKVGLVMALHAVAALPDRDGVTILVTGDEEVGSPTSRALIESEAAGALAVFVTEASGDGGALKIERKGTSIYEVRVTGRAAHAGLEPEKGVNATLELAHQALAVAGSRGCGARHDRDADCDRRGHHHEHGSCFGIVRRRRARLHDRRAGTRRRRDARAHRSAPRCRASPSRAVPIGPRWSPPHPRRSSTARSPSHPGSAWNRSSASPSGAPATATSRPGSASRPSTASGAVGGGAHADDEHVVVDAIAPRTALLGALIFELLEQGDS